MDIMKASAVIVFFFVRSIGCNGLICCRTFGSLVYYCYFLLPLNFQKIYANLFLTLSINRVRTLYHGCFASYFTAAKTTSWLLVQRNDAKQEVTIRQWSHVSCSATLTRVTSGYKSSWGADGKCRRNIHIPITRLHNIHTHTHKH